MATRRSRIRLPRISEMFGKIEERTGGFGVLRGALRSLIGHGYERTLDLTKNDYLLFRAIYNASTIPGNPTKQNGEEFILAAAWAKPIINTAAAFAVGAGFTVSLGGSKENQAIKDAEDDLNRRISEDIDSIYDWIKYGYRDGDSYLFMDELGKLSQERPETVDVIVDAVTGETVGFNVTEGVTIKDPNDGKEKKYTYLKQYRKSLVRISRWPENSDQSKAEILFERVFMRGTAVDTQLTDEDGKPIPVDALPEELDERPLPIVHFRNEPEPKFVYGTSDLQNVLIHFRNYTAVLEEATKREIYNNNPSLVYKGVKEPDDEDTDVDPDEPGKRKLPTQQEDVIYLEDPDADVKYLTVEVDMEATDKLLVKYFYLVVQASETPEFLFGGAVSSSKASVSEQMPVVLQKAERKQKQMRKTLIELVKLYINRQLDLSNPDYFALRDIDLEISITFPEIGSEDQDALLKVVTLLLQESAISKETAIRLLLANKIDNPQEELEKALKESNDSAAGDTAFRGRLNAELAASTGGSGGTRNA